MRFELHRALRDTLGNDVADTLMEHLPHGGRLKAAVDSL